MSHVALNVPVHGDGPISLQGLTVAQRTVFDALQEFCFDGPVCWPSQQTLAIRCGYSLCYVNRIIGQLRRLGLLTIQKARRGKWDHNVYRLAFWVPPLRKRTLRNIAWIKAEIAREIARRKQRVQTKGTPGAYSASSQHSTSVVSDLGEPAWLVARAQQQRNDRPESSATSPDAHNGAVGHVRCAPAGTHETSKEDHDIRPITTTIATVAAFALTNTPSAQAHAGCHSASCRERVARHNCTQAKPVWCVKRAILTYRLTGWQAAWMRRVPGCESGWNPYAVNGRPLNPAPVPLVAGVSTGLYQFMPSTFRTTPYGHRWIWSAKWQALAAAFMVRAGRTGEWACR